MFVPLFFNIERVYGFYNMIIWLLCVNFDTFQLLFSDYMQKSMSVRNIWLHSLAPSNVAVSVRNEEELHVLNLCFRKKFMKAFMSL